MPAGQSLKDRRVVDPVLTTLALGYEPQNKAGTVAFPVVPVKLSEGKVVRFDKSQFAEYDTLRSPGGDYKRVRRGYSADPYSLEDHGLEYPINDDENEESIEADIVDEQEDAAQYLSELHSMDHERKSAQLITDASKYPSDASEVLVGQDRWSDPNSNIIKQFEVWGNKIRGRIGKPPNAAIIGATPFSNLRAHPQFSRIILSGDRVVTNPERLAKELGLEIVAIGEAVSLGADDEFYDIWGNNVWLGYTDPQALKNGRRLLAPVRGGRRVSMQARKRLSFGYTYMKIGHPFLPPAYREERNDSTVYKIKAKWGLQMTALNAGYLAQDVS